MTLLPLLLWLLLPISLLRPSRYSCLHSATNIRLSFTRQQFISKHGRSLILLKKLKPVGVTLVPYLLLRNRLDGSQKHIIILQSHRYSVFLGWIAALTIEATIVDSVDCCASGSSWTGTPFPEHWLIKAFEHLEKASYGIAYERARLERPHEANYLSNCMSTTSTTTTTISTTLELFSYLISNPPLRQTHLHKSIPVK